MENILTNDIDIIICYIHIVPHQLRLSHGVKISVPQPRAILHDTFSTKGTPSLQTEIMYVWVVFSL